MQDLREEAGSALAPAVARPRRNPQFHQRDRRARLERLLTTEIVPRLCDSHPPVTPARLRPTAPLDALIEALLATEMTQISAYERTWSTQLPDAEYMLDVLAPAARKLGVLWEEDACDFFDVTQGVSRLQAMLARIEEAPPRRSNLSMLLLSAPGETHSFGADLAAELFRREGWRVERGEASQMKRIGQRRFDALGVSCACERAYADLPEFLAAARAQARPGKTAIVVGGALFTAHPALGCELGADFAATDREAARRISRALVDRRHM